MKKKATIRDHVCTQAMLLGQMSSDIKNVNENIVKLNTSVTELLQDKWTKKGFMMFGKGIIGLVGFGLGCLFEWFKK